MPRPTASAAPLTIVRRRRRRQVAAAGACARRAPPCRSSGRTATGTRPPTPVPHAPVAAAAPPRHPRRRVGSRGGRGADPRGRAPHPALLPWLPLLAPAVGAEVDPTDAVDALDDSFRAGPRARGARSPPGRAARRHPAASIIDDAHWVDPASAAALAARLRQRHACTRCSSSRRDVAGRPGDRPARGIALGGPVATTTPATSWRPSRGARCCRATSPRSLARADGNPLYLDRARGRPLRGRRDARHRAAHRRAHRRPHRVGAGGPPPRGRARHGASRSRSSCAASGPVSSRRPRASRGSSSCSRTPCAFRNELFRDVAYEQLNYQARRELHRAAAAILVADPELAAGARRRRC